MGDPGTTEHFALPRYAYIFVMKQTGVDEWEVWRREERALAAQDWKRTRYYGLNATRGDSIYKYEGDIYYLLNNDAPTGRVFAICSYRKLEFSRSLASIDDMDDLLGLKFETAPDSIQEDLQNIYSTPYNYEREGRYYCSFDCSSGHRYNLDLLLYHVASKVDIKWNVADTVRIKPDPSQAVRLTYMQARYLFNEPAYCFKPMENVTANLPSTGATRQLVRPEDEGLWWEGRAYFYTIPYTVSGSPYYFPLQMVLRTNNSSEDYRPTLNLRIDTSSPFVPWLRADFNLSKPLGDNEVVKTVENS